MRKADDVLREVFSQRNWQKNIGIKPNHAGELKKRFFSSEMKYHAKIELLKRLGYDVEIFVKEDGE